MNVDHHSFASSVPLWVLHATWLSVHNETEQFSRCMSPFWPWRTETPSPNSLPIPIYSLDKEETSINSCLHWHHLTISLSSWTALTSPRNLAQATNLTAPHRNLWKDPSSLQLKASTEALYSVTLWIPVSTRQKVLALEAPPYIKLQIPNKIWRPLAPLRHWQSSPEWRHPSPWCAVKTQLCFSNRLCRWYLGELTIFFSL